MLLSIILVMTKAEVICDVRRCGFAYAARLLRYFKMVASVLGFEGHLQIISQRIGWNLRTAISVKFSSTLVMAGIETIFQWFMKLFLRLNDFHSGRH